MRVNTSGDPLHEELRNVARPARRERSSNPNTDFLSLARPGYTFAFPTKFQKPQRPRNQANGATTAACSLRARRRVLVGFGCFSLALGCRHEACGIGCGFFDYRFCELICCLLSCTHGMLARFAWSWTR